MSDHRVAQIFRVARAGLPKPQRIAQSLCDGKNANGFQSTTIKFRHDSTEKQLMTNTIVVDREIQGGVPVFAGTRVSIKNLFDYLEEGDSLEVFLGQFPSVSREMAVAVLEQASISLDKQGQADLVQLLNTPAQPALAMRDLMALPDLPAHRK